MCLAIPGHIERLKQGVSGDYDVLFRRFDGSEVWAIISSTPVHDDGQYVGALTMVLDVTERKRLEGNLRQAQKMERWDNWPAGSLTISTTFSQRSWAIANWFRHRLLQTTQFEQTSTELEGPARAPPHSHASCSHSLDETGARAPGCRVASQMRRRWV